MKRAHALLSVLVASSALCAPPEGNVINVRAFGPHIPGDLVRYVARKAMPFPPMAPDAGDPAQVTPRKVILRLCGSLRLNDYYPEFVAANKKALLADQPIDAAELPGIVWPKCLYVENGPPQEPVVVGVTGSTAVAICTRLTGGDCGPDTLKIFFEPAMAQGVNIHDVRLGQKLAVAYWTRPVELRSTELDAHDFWQALIRAAGPKWKTVMKRLDANVGEIVVADDGECQPAAGPPYDVSAVRSAYRFSHDHATQALLYPRPAHVVVVDNGFFGANPRRGPGKAFDGSPFLPAHFELVPGSVIAKSITSERLLYPINYQHDLSADTISGHGTHVVGLILGGPAFRPYWETLRRDGSSWIRITVINAGRGSVSLIPGTPDLLKGEFDKPGRIVNLSVAYDRSTSPGIAATFDGVFTKVPNNLYIVAAGNGRGQNVRAEIYPAALGGLQAPHVITVAALEAGDRIARFSNVGSQAVDMAAPGCQIRSWLQDDPSDVPLNGTSQAAPLVTFAASLLQSIVSDAQPRTLKYRIVTSGDLIHHKDQREVVFRVKLNVAKALYVFHDYIRIDETPAVSYLGALQDLSGVRCQDERQEFSFDDIWAYKRRLEGWVYHGKVNSQLHAPCRLADDAEATVHFQTSHRINASGEIEAHDAVKSVPLRVVEEIVTRIPPKLLGK